MTLPAASSILGPVRFAYSLRPGRMVLTRLLGKILGDGRATSSREFESTFPVMRKNHGGLNSVRMALKLTARLLALCLPLWPSFAQEQTETLTSPLDLDSVQTPQFNRPSNFRVTSSSAGLNLMPAASPLLSTASLPETPHKNTLLLSTNSCFSPSQIDLFSACLTVPPKRLTISSTDFDLLSVKPILPAPRASERFHWKAALWQSFGFLLVGHAFRLTNDGGARYLLFHKPFWHDYWASTDNFHMSRWGDGDSFLVNYIGHPMEGAVAGDIFLNNDPKGRSARFGKSSTYWYSRLKAMAWATVFEAYFEFGPVLSEAAIGNEGGYTHVPGCGLTPCDHYPG